MISPSARESRAELRPPGGQMGNSQSGRGREAAVKRKGAGGREALTLSSQKGNLTANQSERTDMELLRDEVTSF